ncbi:MAG: hypothetical protein H6741_32055 [Alphaproteobacteria bacterium]|nr:hypothetical protein [Alphaproteobacteria bacterium]
MSALPPRGVAAEDDFVAAMREAAPEALMQAVREALRAGRPQLAGRLVGLLGEAAPDDEDLNKALRAARFLCVTPQDPVMLQVLDEALSRLQARGVQRAKQRARDSVQKEARYFGGEAAPRRGRRR